MAKCDLSIELDHPERVYVGGDKITGTVRVLADADVRCKALEVSSGWRTHGRGNIARGTTEAVTLFAGDWTAGQRESYRFELNVAAWPPSHRGDFINVDHYVDARAKIPWAFDPKTSQEYVMCPVTDPDPSSVVDPDVVTGCVRYGMIALILLAVTLALGAMGVGLATNPFAALIVASIVVPLVGFFVARKVLPKWLLGSVQSELITPGVSPGGRVDARLAVQPKRPVRLNAITAELTGAEVCVSGSGSNRKTHRHVFFHEKHTLLGPSTLQAGDQKEIHMDFPIPVDAPYSFTLNDNRVTWTIDLRIDLPRWPDWTKTLPLKVVPDGGPADRPQATEIRTAGDSTTQRSNGPGTETDASGATGSTDEITFAETAAHLWELRNDSSRIDILVEAVTGMTFEIDAIIERRLLYSGEEDPHCFKDGYAVWARCDDPPLPLVLYIPRELGDDFEQAGRDAWPCRGMIVGWDHQHRRLQVKVLGR
jgi:hypothetical protein